MEIFTKYFTAILLFSVIAIANADTSESSNLLPKISDYTAFFNTQYAKAVDGDANAQLYIGVLYEHGLGIGKDLTLSHVYYNLASASGAQEATSQRKRIEKLLSKDEFANARKLAKLYKPGVGIDHPRQISSIELMSKNTQIETESNDVNFDENAKLNDDEIEVSSANNTDQYENLYNAIIDNNTIEVQKLVSSGADVNYRFDGDMTPLMLASSFGNLSTVGTLLDLGANANLKSKDNKTAFDIATAAEHKYVATVLRTKTLIYDEVVKDTQVYLSKLGYNPGPADGLYGKSTKRALEKFSTDYSQQFAIEISQLQLDTLRNAYNDYNTKKRNEQKLQESIQVAKQNNIPQAEKNIATKTAAVTTNTQPTKKPATKPVTKPATKTVVASIPKPTQSKKKSVQLKKVGKYPDISGTYNAITFAVFSKCGAYNKNIEYQAEETINNLKDNGRFKISYKAPRLNCSGDGQFFDDFKNLQGSYACSYETTNGFRGTLKMSIAGVVEEEKIYMKYKGKDTSPGVSCKYDWERTLTTIQ